MPAYNVSLEVWGECASSLFYIYCFAKYLLFWCGDDFDKVGVYKDVELKKYTGIIGGGG